MVEALREDLQKEIGDAVGSQVGSYMLKFAPQGMVVPVELPAPGQEIRDTPALSSSNGAVRKADMDGMVCMIMDRVVERVKEDECLCKVTAQYEQVKLALDELLLKIGSFDASAPQPNSPDSVELFNMMKAAQLDVRRLRQQRNRDYSE